MRWRLIFWLCFSIAAPALANPPSPSTVINCVPKIKPGPLSRGLGFLWTTIGGLQYDLVSNSLAAPYTGAGPVAGPYGSQTAIGAAGIAFSTTGQPPKVVTTDNGAGTGNFTIFALANPTASATEGQLLAFGHFGVTTNLFTNNNSTSGILAVFLTDGVCTTTCGGTATNSAVIDGNWHMFASVIGGLPTNWIVYVDGLSVATTASNPTSAYASLAIDKAGVGGFVDGTTPITGSIALAGEYNRALTAAEISTLSINPMDALLTCQ